MASPRRGKPRYLELADHFTARIAAGDYPVGGLLPTELEICAHFEVSRHTARSALTQLINAGLVSRRAGAGTRVLASRSAMRYQHEVDNIEDLLQYGSETELVVSRSQVEAVDAALALQLGVTTGSRIVRIAATRFEVPSRVAVAVTDVAIPLVRGLAVDKLLDQAVAPRNIARMLDPSRLSRVEQVFDAAEFSPDAAEILDVPAHSPALRVQRHYRDSAGKVAAFAVSLHPAGRFAYRMVLNRRGE